MRLLKRGVMAGVVSLTAFGCGGDDGDDGAASCSASNPCPSGQYCNYTQQALGAQSPDCSQCPEQCAAMGGTPNQCAAACAQLCLGGGDTGGGDTGGGNADAGVGDNRGGGEATGTCVDNPQNTGNNGGGWAWGPTPGSTRIGTAVRAWRSPRRGRTPHPRLAVLRRPARATVVMSIVQPGRFAIRESARQQWHGTCCCSGQL